MRTSLFGMCGLTNFAIPTQPTVRAEAGANGAFTLGANTTTNLFRTFSRQPLHHALFAAETRVATNHKDVPLPVIIDRARREREQERVKESGVPLYAPTPEPPHPEERAPRKPAEEESQRGIVEIGGADDPSVVDFTI